MTAAALAPIEFEIFQDASDQQWRAYGKRNNTIIVFLPSRGTREWAVDGILELFPDAVIHPDPSSFNRTEDCTRRCLDAPVPICVCTEFERQHEALDGIMNGTRGVKASQRYKLIHSALKELHEIKSCHVCHPPDPVPE